MAPVSQTITDAYREHAVEFEGATTNTAVPMKNNKRLKVWQPGVEIADKVGEIVPYLSGRECSGLRVRMVRSAARIYADGRRGCGYNPLAQAAIAELDCHLELAERKNKVPIRLVRELSELIVQERRTIAAYRNKH